MRMNWFIGNRYRVLLLSLTALVILTPLLRATAFTRILLDFLTSIVFLAALWAVFKRHRTRMIAVLFGIPTLIGLWTGYLIPGIPKFPLAVSFHAIAAIFFSFSVVAMLRGLFNDRKISTDSIYGAFCGYLMAGLVFGNLYSLVELNVPGSFAGDAFKDRSVHDHHFLLTYFSFLTITTVGYGDVIPASDSARGLAVIEAIFGQFYIAVLVAELIGRRTGQAALPPSEPRP
jgi:hypothetical protein